MSLNIEVDAVAAILLSDGWHFVVPKSFEIDAWEFHHGQTRGSAPRVCDTGARWQEVSGHPYWVQCPLTSILAVRTE